MPSPAAIVRLSALLLLPACERQTEPLPAPIAARTMGGDSLRPGVNVIVCSADDAGCVPSYAVSCRLPGAADSTGAAPLSPDQQAWCATPPDAD